MQPVWQDWVIYWTLGNFSKSVATINLPKSPTFLGNFCKCVKIFHYSSEIIFGQFYRHLATFYWSHCCCCWKESPPSKLMWQKWSRRRFSLSNNVWKGAFSRGHSMFTMPATFHTLFAPLLLSLSFLLLVLAFHSILPLSLSLCYHFNNCTFFQFALASRIVDLIAIPPSILPMLHRNMKSKPAKAVCFQI